MAALSEIKLVLGITGENIVTSALNNVGAATKKAAADADKLSQGMDLLKSAALRLGAAFAGIRIFDAFKDMATMAARFETLGVVMNVIGNNAGYTSKQMNEFQKALEKNGISMMESRNTLSAMAAAQMDLAKSSQLSRIAQDAAVIGGMNSSEAFQRMIDGIKSAQVEILRNIGINVNFEQAYQKTAKSLNKTTDALSENEKLQARTNAVMEQGSKIAGTYEAAMGTAGKQMTSMQRYIDNLKITLGQTFNDSLIMLIGGFTNALKSGNTAATELSQKNQLKAWGRDIATALAVVADGLTIAYKLINELVLTGVAGFTQLYYGAKSLWQALSFDFSGASESFKNMLSAGAAWFDLSKQNLSGMTKYQDTLKKLFADQDNAEKNKLAAQKLLEAEQKRIDSGQKTRNAERLAEIDAFAKKHESAWGAIIVKQLESTGQYELAAQKQIELNHLTSEYKSLIEGVNKGIPQAVNAKSAQDLADQLKIVDATNKRSALLRNISDETDKINTEIAKTVGLSADDAAILEQRRSHSQAIHDLVDKINKAVADPKLQAAYQQQLDGENILNGLKTKELETQKQINRLKSEENLISQIILGFQQSGMELLQQEIDLMERKKGAVDIEEQIRKTKQMSAAATGEEKLIFDKYLQQIEYQQQLFNQGLITKDQLLQRIGLQKAGEDANAAAIGNQNALLNDQLATKKAIVSLSQATTIGDALNAPFELGAVSQVFTVSQVSTIGGMQTASNNITQAAQASSSAATTAVDTWEKAQDAAKSMGEDLTVRILEAQGETEKAALTRLWIQQQKELNDAVAAGVDVTELSKVQHLEYAKAIKDIEIKVLEEAAKTAKELLDKTRSAFSDAIDSMETNIKTAFNQITDAIDKFRAAAKNLKNSILDIRGGEDSNLTAAQKYNNARSTFISTYQKGMGGDLDSLNALGDIGKTYLGLAKELSVSQLDYNRAAAAVQTDLANAANFSDTIANTLQPQKDIMQLQLDMLSLIKDAIKIDNIAAVGAITAALIHTINPALGAINGTTGGVTAILKGSTNPALGAINGTTGGVTAILKGSTNPALGAINASTGGVTAALTNTINPALGAINGTTGGVTAALTNTINPALGAINGTTGGVTAALTNTINPSLGNVKDNLTTKGLGSLFGDYKDAYDRTIATGGQLTATQQSTASTASFMESLLNKNWSPSITVSPTVNVTVSGTTATSSSSTPAATTSANTITKYYVVETGYWGSVGLPSYHPGQTEWQKQISYNSGTTWADIGAPQWLTTGFTPSFAVGSAYIPNDMTANIHRGEKIIDPQSSAILNKYGIKVSGNSADISELATELRALRAEMADVKAGIAGVARNTGETSRQLKRWDGDGMPEQRVV